jgi:hypothetical protein
MHLKANLWRITENPDSKEINNYPFRVQDIFGVMKTVGLENAVLVSIDPYDFNNDPKIIKEQVELLMRSSIENGIVVIAQAYVSFEEFPRSEFYYEKAEEVSEEEKIGKKELPFDEVIDRQSKILMDAGFIDLSFYTQLEFSKVFISPINRNGMKVFNMANELSRK